MINQLQKFREEIDKIDDQILILLKERIKLMGKIGELKKQNKLSIRDSDRESEKMNTIKEKSAKLNLPEQLISRIWKIIFDQSEIIEK